MEQLYKDKMYNLGYTTFVCDIFPNWEDVKDELLLPGRKSGSGNGTIHVFLGAADSELRREFPDYYSSVEEGEDPSVHAVKVKHYFLASNIVSLIGYICQYDVNRNIPFTDEVQEILNYLNTSNQKNGLLETSSLFKLSTGSSKLRPYFKQFDSTGAFSKLVRKILLPNSSYKISLFKNENGEYAAFWLIGFDWQSNFEADSNSSHFQQKIELPKDKDVRSRQIIFYGAPGTGKSHTIKTKTEGEHVVRTTFHPDSDYSTFVGAYKPTTKPSYVRDSTGRVVVENNEKVVEDRIVYEFVPQAFLQAYVSAWKYYANALSEEPEKQFLIIEEINRGNCAQIFGDLFQLLDRNAKGYSEYPITADKDMEKFLSDAFEGLAITNEEALGKMFDDPFIAQKIALGQVLLLPPNLYIWATMNTSDQSLFPIDSAFKRRWDWKFIPISEAISEDTKQPLKWTIHVGNKDYDWWSFLQAINRRIGDMTNSQDKKLGYFFCKADDGKINAETLVDKVFFFLWNEVLKDYEQEQDFLKAGNGGYLTFDQFYRVNEQGETEIEEDKVETLLDNLGIESVESLDDAKPVDAQDSSNESDTSLLDRYLDFWNKFQASYEDSDSFKDLFTNPKGQRQNWMDIGGLNRPYHICLSVNYRTNKIRMQVYFRQDRDRNALDKFMDALDHISETMGQEVTTGAGSKYTYLQLYKDFNMDNDDWNDAFNWYHEECVKFKHLVDEIDPK
jgi:hypothetical protein